METPSSPVFTKRIREVNNDRKEKSAKPIFTFSDYEISIILNMIKIGG